MLNVFQEGKQKLTQRFTEVFVPSTRDSYFHRDPQRKQLGGTL